MSELEAARVDDRRIPVGTHRRLAVTLTEVRISQFEVDRFQICVQGPQPPQVRTGKHVAGHQHLEKRVVPEFGAHRAQRAHGLRALCKEMLIAGVCPQIAIGTYPGPHGDRQSRQQQWPAEAQDRPRPQPKELTALNGPQRRVLAGEAELLLTVGLGHRGKPRLCANHPTPGLPTVSEILRIPPPKTVEIRSRRSCLRRAPAGRPAGAYPGYTSYRAQRSRLHAASCPHHAGPNGQRRHDRWAGLLLRVCSDRRVDGGLELRKGADRSVARGHTGGIQPERHDLVA